VRLLKTRPKQGGEPGALGQGALAAAAAAQPAPGGSSRSRRGPAGCRRSARRGSGTGVGSCPVLVLVLVRRCATVRHGAQAAPHPTCHGHGDIGHLRAVLQVLVLLDELGQRGGHGELVGVGVDSLGLLALHKLDPILVVGGGVELLGVVLLQRRPGLLLGLGGSGLRLLGLRRSNHGEGLRRGPASCEQTTPLRLGPMAGSRRR
jgi:hypothetical protein